MERQTWDHSAVSTERVDSDVVDFAIAAYREEGRWSVSALPSRIATSVESLAAALRQFPGEGGVFGFVGVGDEFFIAVRENSGRLRGFVSDAAAVLDWSLAEELADALDIDMDEEDLEEYVPLGDLRIFADFGITESDIELVCEEGDFYPDEQVRSIAKRLGFDGELKSALRSR